MFHKSPLPPSTTATATAADADDLSTSCPDPTYFETSKRYDPLDGPVVYGHPSTTTSGILIKTVTAVELLHLNLDRFRAATPSSDPADEDEFCRRLRRVGAVWWSSYHAWVDAEVFRGELMSSEENVTRVVVETGWPSSGSGGVWVFRYDADKWDATSRTVASHLRLALNMDERCQIIQEFGGSLFADPDTCEELRMDTMMNSAAG